MLPWTRLSIDQSSLQGCTSVTLHAQITRVAYTWLGSTPPRLSDTTQSILRLIREVPAGLQPYGQGGHGPITPRSPDRCEEGEFECRSAIRPCRNAELDVFQSFRTRLHCGGAQTRNPTYR